MTTAMSVSYGNAAVPRMNGKRRDKMNWKWQKKGTSNICVINCAMHRNAERDIG